MKNLLLFFLSSTAAFAGNIRDGGNSGGGGNLNAAPVSQQLIFQFLTDTDAADNARSLALAFLYKAAPRNPRQRANPTFDHFTSTDPERNKLYVSAGQKMYSPGFPIFPAIAASHLSVDEHPCLDPNTGIEADGSADTRTQEVCFNSKRIAAKGLSYQGYQKLLIALMAHEYSHLVGTNEDEANLIQYDALNEISLDSSHSPFRNGLTPLVFESSALEQASNDLLRNLEGMSPNKLCLKLIDLGQTTGKLTGAVFQFTEDHGLQLISPDSNILLQSAGFKATNLLSYCASTPLAPDLDPPYVHKYFRVGEDAMSVEQFMMRSWGYADFSVTGSLRRVDGGDRARLKAEVQEIHDLALRAVPNDVHH